MGESMEFGGGVERGEVIEVDLVFFFSAFIKVTVADACFLFPFYLFSPPCKNDFCD